MAPSRNADSHAADVTANDRIAIIGAGLAGIAMAVQLKRLVNHQNFEIYEKSEDIGGTWSQNRYPNLSCDVPSEFYSYSFFQNPDWSEKYASQGEILAYIRSCARHFELEPRIHLQQECTAVSWSEADALWTLSLTDLASRPRPRPYTVQARYVVTAVGVLSVPNGLDGLAPLREFGGQCFHTARWRDVDFDGKRVVVVGNGCSANQVIPWILNECRPKDLVQIARSEQWVAPKANYPVSSFTKWCLRYIPLAMRLRRLWSAYQHDRGFLAYRNTQAGRRARRAGSDAIRSYMASASSPAYRDALVPRHDELGAKRPVMDHGYLEATSRDNFALVRCDGLRAVEGADRRTLVDGAGNRHEGVDVVVVANGFRTQDLLSPMRVLGTGEEDLREVWEARGGSEAYMGVSVSGFPNFFMLAGPNTLPSGNSTLHGIECSVVYIMRLLGGLWARSGGGARGAPVAIEPTPEAVASFNGELQRKMKGLVYTSEVRTYFINPQSGKNTLIWPGTQFSFWWSRCVSRLQWSHWSITKHKELDGQ